MMFSGLTGLKLGGSPVNDSPFKRWTPGAPMQTPPARPLLFLFSKSDVIQLGSIQSDSMRAEA
jgi:hypothetical protein